MSQIRRKARSSGWRVAICDNPEDKAFPMRPHRILLLWILLLSAAGLGVAAQNIPQVAPQLGPPPLVLLGGPIIDVTDWGRSPLDQPNSLVTTQNGRIPDFGSRFVIQPPKNAQVIDCTGKFLIRGLVDGFTGM